MGLFDNKNNLSREELRRILDKIRREYAKSAQKYGESMFNVNAFNDRYTEALRKNTDLTVFFGAEVQALEGIKQNIIEKEEEKARLEEEEKNKYNNSYEKVADQMLSKFEKMVEKYPRRKICDGAAAEIEHIFGGMTELFGIITLLRNIFKGCGDYSLEYLLQETDSKFTSFVIEMAGKPPSIWQDYIIAFERDNATREVERAEMEVLKECGLFLNEVKKVCAEILENIDRIDTTAVLELSEDFLQTYPRIANSLNGKTHGDAVKAAAAYSARIVQDFRLQNLKRGV